MIPKTWRAHMYLTRGGHFDEESVWRPGTEDPVAALGLAAPVDTAETEGGDATRLQLDLYFWPGTVMDGATAADRVRIAQGPYKGLWEVVEDAQVWPLGAKLSVRRVGGAHA